MLIEYVYHITEQSFEEFVIQAVVLYCLSKITSQNNFYFLLAYFFLLLLFSGVLLVFNECDLSAILLWIVYFGVLIIFFLYSLMWFEVDKVSKYNTDLQNFLWKNYAYLLILLLFITTITTKFRVVCLTPIFFIDYYSLLNLDMLEELEPLGLGIINHTTFLFLLNTYMLFLTCCCVIHIIIIAKQLKYYSVNLFYQYYSRLELLSDFLVYKNQFFFYKSTWVILSFFL